MFQYSVRSFFAQWVDKVMRKVINLTSERSFVQQGCKRIQLTHRPAR